MMETLNTTTQPDNTEIVFETDSGISVEEQREILSGLETLTEKNHLELPESSFKIPAKKKGGLFPLLINAAAVILVAGGFFLLFSFHGQEDLKVREGTVVLGITERALIQEIRKETAREITAKEREITDMIDKLADVDIEVQELQKAADRQLNEREAELRAIMAREIEAERQRLMAQNLSEAAIAERLRAFDAERILRLDGELNSFRAQLETERQQSAGNLQRLQEEYRTSLTNLQTERAQILEASRIREANQKAQAEKQLGELSGRYEQSRAELGTAQEELRRLSSEQERAALVEGQLAGFYSSVQNQLHAEQLKEAGDTLNAMREFINTPSFRNVRALQNRKDMHLAAIAAFQGLIDETLKVRQLSSVPPVDEEAVKAPLNAQISALNLQLQDQKNEIAALQKNAAEGSGLGRQVTELQSQVTVLQKDKDALQAQHDTLNETLTQRNNTIAEKDTAIADLQTQLATIRQALQSLSQ
ncbi:hypothetical protein AGMMS49928_02720 [Spirochaetia bacterium]|nr:hypothetical protein AGMMS49928_02720 [Spirochaetia bacterium]